MEFIFREFTAVGVSPPHQGELHVRPSEAVPGRLELAALVFEKGLAALAGSRGHVERFVLPPDPTLDDMLAAAFAECLMRGQELPPGAKLFAIYAANVREGLRTTALPLEDSLEGIYLAIRHTAPDDLTQADAAARFLARWHPLAERILAAAREGLDPVTKSLVAGNPEFARERAFLAQDRSVYYQQDAPRAQRWLVRIPGGPENALPGLVLPGPKSVLWKYWSREDREAPGGKGFVFLAAFEQEKHWRFSTPPEQNLPISTLAKKLQQAEVTRNPRHDPQDPWYDGRNHGFTMVGAPKKTGTALSDRQVLQIAKSWGRARVVQRHAKWPLAAGAGLGLCLLGLGFILFPHPNPKGAPEHLFQVNVEFNRQAVKPQQQYREEPGKDKGRLFWVGFDKPIQPGNNKLTITTTSEKVNHNFKFWVTLQSSTDLVVKDLKLKINNDWPPIDQRPEASTSRKWESQEVPAFLGFGENTIYLEFYSAHNQPLPANVQVNWRVDLEYKRDLYLLAVGVKNYEKANSSLSNLDYADQDAEDLAKVFKEQKGTLFNEIGSMEVLKNEQAKKEALVKSLYDLTRRAARSKRPSLVVAAFSGHGKLGKNGRFFFLPHDYNPNVVQVEGANAISWDDILAILKDYSKDDSNDRSWPTLVIMDACHSGAIQGETGLHGSELSAQLQGSISRPMQGSIVDASPVLTLVACRADDRAWENQEAKNGALTLALLEGLQGVRRVKKIAAPRLPQEENPGDLVTLNVLSAYVKARVSKLADERAAVVAVPSTGMIPDFIPISSGQTNRP